eukprot:CAMPEP_0175087850 /NCGR_PEP_ID=MMETSP0052_2-20121109/30061_1 /TAXON_ID=51329 ORGANISM="Polytomella parva, Strain SAG 63-3" /NCGR_SAMPLE_ID=MMETSP0052_2 /ASSEMBLY_ACC=CAM_ASM_000194 /LENGTH=803 /DNA_ID=CAMNT_0016360245 /DNA_START=115 /DNA_END=2527 /DNA_ORIENTATION=-
MDSSREIAKLKQALKRIEVGKRSFAEESQRVIQAQKTAIDKLRKDNESYESSIAYNVKQSGIGAQLRNSSSGSSSQTAGDDSSNARQQELLELLDTFSRKVHVEHTQLDLLSQELEIRQAKALSLRKATGGSEGARAINVAGVKQIKLLEARVERATKRFNDTVASGRHVRDEIEALARRRSGVMNTISKLEREVSALHGEALSLSDAARIALEAASEADAQAAAIRAADDRERLAFEMERRELKKTQIAEKKLLEAQARRMQRALERAEGVEATKGGGQGGSVESNPEKNSGNCGSETSELSDEQFIERLAAISGLPKVTSSALPRLVSYFLNLESSNLQRFNACAQLSRRCKELDAKAAEAEANMRELQLDAVMAKQESVTLTLSRRDAAAARAKEAEDKCVLLEARMKDLHEATRYALRALGAPPVDNDEGMKFINSLKINTDLGRSNSSSSSKNEPQSKGHVGVAASALRSGSASHGAGSLAQQIGSGSISTSGLPPRPPSSIRRAALPSPGHVEGWNSYGSAHDGSREDVRDHFKTNNSNNSNSNNTYLSRPASGQGDFFKPFKASLNADDEEEDGKEGGDIKIIQSAGIVEEADNNGTQASLNNVDDEDGSQIQEGKGDASFMATSDPGDVIHLKEKQWQTLALDLSRLESRAHSLLTINKIIMGKAGGMSVSSVGSNTVGGGELSPHKGLNPMLGSKPSRLKLEASRPASRQASGAFGKTAVAVAAAAAGIVLPCSLRKGSAGSRRGGKDTSLRDAGGKSEVDSRDSDEDDDDDDDDSMPLSREQLQARIVSKMMV